MAPKVVRRRKYRTGVNTKNLKQLSVRVSEDVHTFFEMNSYDESGRKLSKAKVLEKLVAFVGDRLTFSRGAANR